MSQVTVSIRIHNFFFSKDVFRGTHYATRLLLHDIINLG